MQRSVSHRVDARARAIFEEAFAVWAPEPFDKNDYAKDYFVQLTDGEGSLTGESFFVQLKGSQKPSYDDDCVVVKLHTRHLRHWVEDVTLPVFVVLIDVESRMGYWLFVQQYVVDNNLRANVHSQKTLSVRIPFANAIGCMDGLARAVFEANAFMLALRPPALDAAMQTQSRFWESLDPRFRVAVTASTLHGTQFTLNPKEDIGVSLRISGRPDGFREKMRALFEEASQCR